MMVDDLAGTIGAVNSSPLLNGLARSPQLVAWLVSVAHHDTSFKIKDRCGVASSRSPKSVQKKFAFRNGLDGHGAPVLPDLPPSEHQPS
jgi:hypothetical protein